MSGCLHVTLILVVLIAPSACLSAVGVERVPLQTTSNVSSVSQLVAALANLSISTIVVGAGHYPLDSQLSITRSVSIQAAVPGGVVLDAQGNGRKTRGIRTHAADPCKLSSLQSNRFEPLRLNSGSTGVIVISTSGTVELAGLSITCGYLDGDPGPGGGGLYIQDGTVDIINSDIFGNTASDGNGGGISIDRGYLTITATNIYSNWAASGNGGGLSISGGTVTITNSQMYSNMAAYGGGLLVDGGVTEIVSCSVHSNIGSPNQGQNVAINRGDACTVFTTIVDVFGTLGPCASECQPSKNCSSWVCPKCCQEGIPHGTACNKCVHDKCTPLSPLTSPLQNKLAASGMPPSRCYASE